MRIPTLFAMGLIGFSTVLHAAPITLTIDSAQTWEQYQLGQTGLGMQSGKFTKTRGTIVLDKENQSGTVQVEIESPMLQNIYFQSSSLMFTGDKLISVAGTLTLMGISKPVTLLVTRFDNDTNSNGKLIYTANAETTIKLSDFDIKTYIPGFPDDVKLSLFIVASN